MNIVLFGAGSIGKAIAYYFLCNNIASKITLVDKNNNQLGSCVCDLSKYTSLKKLSVNNFTDIEKIISESDLVLLAVPWKAHSIIIESTIKYNKAMLTISRPTYDELPLLEKKLKGITSPVIIGCGLEPGLTEIMALHCANYFDKLDELHIKCGGITNKAPNNTLKYKALYGTNYLPIAMRRAYSVENSTLIEVQRFSGKENVYLPEIGELEAWHDGMVPWLHQHKKIASAHTISQKTLRWPGFSDAIKKLNSLGLLDEKEIEINGVRVSPKKYIEHFYADETKLNDEDNKSILLINAAGDIDREKKKIQLKLISSNKNDMGLNSMALITGFTASIIGSFILNGSIKNSGLLKPELIVQGELLKKLILELNSYSVKLEINNDMGFL